jgi:hypothetical protein
VHYDSVDCLKSGVHRSQSHLWDKFSVSPQGCTSQTYANLGCLGTTAGKCFGILVDGMGEGHEGLKRGRPNSGDRVDGRKRRKTRGRAEREWAKSSHFRTDPP